MVGKKYKEAVKKIDVEKIYSLTEGLQLLKEIKFSNFDESLDIAIRLGIDARQTDQMVRGAVSLPHGTGKSVRVLVFAKGEKLSEAESAGADYVGGEDLVEKIQEGWMDFESVVSTPDMMAVVSKIGKILGPRGLMPNPKVGTVTFDVAKVIQELKAGRVEFRNDKGGIIHAAVGKLSFDVQKLTDNLKEFVSAVQRLKPAASKGAFLKSISISSTMSPGLSIDPSNFM